jgi:hypothetical protein
MHRANMSAHERALRSRLSQLIHTVPVLRATLNERHVSCGKKGCRCTEGEKHRALYAVSSRGGKMRQTFVPQDREATVREWVENFHKIRDLLEELSELFWERARPKKR